MTSPLPSDDEVKVNEPPAVPEALREGALSRAAPPLRSATERDPPQLTLEDSKEDGYVGSRIDSFSFCSTEQSCKRLAGLVAHRFFSKPNKKSFTFLLIFEYLSFSSTFLSCVLFSSTFPHCLLTCTRQHVSSRIFVPRSSELYQREAGNLEGMTDFEIAFCLIACFLFCFSCWHWHQCGESQRFPEFKVLIQLEV